MSDMKIHLKLRHLKLVETLVSTRSIRKAATELNVTPAAVSKACLELENILGIKLFIRNPNGLVPHPFCDRIIITAQKIDAEMRNLISDISQNEDSYKGSVKIGFQTPMLQDSIVRGVAKIKRQQPHLNIIIEYGARNHLVSSLEKNCYDFIFINITDIKENSRIHTEKLGEEQYVIASMEEIYSIPDVLENWKYFSNATWVLPVKGLAMREKFDTILALRNLTLPSKRIEINSPVGGEKIVALSDAYTLLPLSMMRDLGRRPSGDNLSLRFLPEMQLDVGVAWMKDIQMSKSAEYAKKFIISKIKKEFF